MVVVSSYAPKTRTQNTGVLGVLRDPTVFTLYHKPFTRLCPIGPMHEQRHNIALECGKHVL